MPSVIPQPSPEGTTLEQRPRRLPAPFHRSPARTKSLSLSRGVRRRPARASSSAGGGPASPATQVFLCSHQGFAAATPYPLRHPHLPGAPGSTVPKLNAPEAHEHQAPSPHRTTRTSPGKRSAGRQRGSGDPTRPPSRGPAVTWAGGPVTWAGPCPSPPTWRPWSAPRGADGDRGMESPGGASPPLPPPPRAASQRAASGSAALFPPPSPRPPSVPCPDHVAPAAGPQRPRAARRQPQLGSRHGGREPQPWRGCLPAL